MIEVFTPEITARLSAFLAERGLGAGPLSVSPIGDGHSNLTYRIECEGRAMVLRRPPPPPLPAGSNDVLREAMFIGAVAGSGVEVPALLATGQTGDVFDVPFYLMSMVDGVVITDKMPAFLAGEGTAAVMAGAMVETMARLHRIDWRATPLAASGRPDGFNARHLRRMAGIVTRGDGTVEPGYAELHEALAANVPPESGSAIIHNDFRLGNVMWRPSAPPVLVAVLDWELATIGDPLMDLAYLVISMPRGGQCLNPIQDMAAALLGPDLPDADGLCSLYFERSTIAPRPIGWYAALVNWKLAILYRYSRLRGEDAYFADTSHETRFLEEAWRWLK